MRRPPPPSPAPPGATGLRLLLALLISWVATDRSAGSAATFPLSGTSLVLSEVTNAEAAVFLQSMRFSKPAQAWTVDISISNRSARPFQGPVVLRIDAFTGTTGPLRPDGLDATGLPFFDFTPVLTGGALPAGAVTPVRSISLGVAAGVPALTTRVFERTQPGAGIGAALVASLNEVGQPLPGVEVTEAGGGAPQSTDPEFGLATLSGPEGPHTWRFALPGFLPAWRNGLLRPGEVTLLPSPRLTPRGTNTATFTPFGAGELTDPGRSLTLRFPAAAFPGETAATLTPLTAQTLPAPLPRGWSPVQGFWVELPRTPSLPGSLVASPWASISKAESVTVARWNEEHLAWEATQTLPGNGTNPLLLAIPGPGAYTLALPDPSPFSPQQDPVVGSALPGITPPDPVPSLLSATGVVLPASSPASRVAAEVTATATVTLRGPASGLASGFILRGAVRESYRMRDGTTRLTPAYDNFLTLYQRPGDAELSTLQGEFPMRPLLLLGSEELETGLVHIDVVTPPLFGGGLISTNGGGAAGDGVRVIAGAGDFPTLQAVEIRGLSQTNFAGFSTNGVELLEAFELLSGVTAPGRSLRVQVDSLPTNAWYVLARVVAQGGLYGLEPRERLRSDSQGKLLSLEPVTGPRLPGITGAGQYVLARVAAPHGLITGTAHNSSGQPAGGLVVRIPGTPWLNFTAPDGTYHLVAPVGEVQMGMLDLTTGDTGAATARITDPALPAVAGINPVSSGPTATLITPLPGASAVPRVTAVVIRFDKPINPATFGPLGIQLLAPGGVHVAASLSLDLRATTATLVPQAGLDPAQLYTVTVSPTLSDPVGRPLAGGGPFTFTTESDLIDRTGVQLILYEPTNGLAPVYGTPGAAEPDSPVILVNETTGATATVRSRADGSFTNVIQAGVDDLLDAILVNRNGTRTTLPASRQILRDGSVGLFNGGGILEAESDGGPVQIIVEPGTVPVKTQFALQTVPLTRVLGFLNGVQPEGGRVLGGIRLAEKGDELKTALHLEFPVDIADLGIPPGKTPDQMTYALTVPHEYDGVVVYEIVDGMNYENGKLVTHSPPFPGVNVRGLIRNAAANLRGTDSFQDKIDAAMNQGGSAVGLMFAPVVIATGDPTTLLGRIYSTATDATTGKPKLLAVQKPVAGAVVTVVRDNAVHDKAGRLQPGQYVAISDADGKIALRVPSETPTSPSGFILQATHPRFPNQAPDATLTRAGGTEVPFARFSIGFAELDIIGYQGPDTLSPILSLTQAPRDAIAGTNGAAGAVLIVRAIDDRKVESLKAVVQSVVPLTLFPPADLPGSVVLTNYDSFPVATFDTGMEKAYGIKSAGKARVTLRITATDGSGNRSQLDQDILFSRDAASPPPVAIANDTTGPRILFAWPPNGATGVAPGEPIRLRFSEPVALPPGQGVLRFSSGHLVTGAVLSPDGREAVVTYSGPLDTPVRYTVGNITDLSGNGLESGLTASFAQATSTAANLPDLQNGGGIVQKGSFAFALERTGEHGKLRVYDIGDPSTPVSVGSLDLPSYPRDIALMPDYAYKLHPDEASCTTNDLVAIIGGLVGAPTSDEGTFYEGQYLWLVNVSDPAHPVVVPAAKTVLTYEIAAATKLRWVPPHLAYLQSGADGSAVGFINVQSFLIGQNADEPTRLSFPVEGFDGLDTTVTNGCYCDPGEKVSLPERTPAEFFGKEYSFIPAVSSAGNQPYVLDFDFENRLALLGIIINGDPADGQGDPPQYQTLYSAAGFLNPSDTTFEFHRTDVLRRVFLMTGIGLKQFSSPQGGDYTVSTRNLALISLQTDQEGVCLATNVIFEGESLVRTGDSDCPLEIRGRLEIPTNQTFKVRSSVIVQPTGSILNWEALSAAVFINHSTNQYSVTQIDDAHTTRRAEALVVLDITDPAAPSHVNTLFFPEKFSEKPPMEVGRVESIERRADGLLAVATDQHVLLLDPSLLALPQRARDVAAWPPAVQGVIPGSGSGARAFDSDSTGVNLVNLGGKHQVVHTAPFIDIVSFGNRSLTNLLAADYLASSNDVYKAQLLRDSLSPTLLLKSRFAVTQRDGVPAQVGLSSPPNVYHVRVDTPGDAGAVLTLVVESIDARGAEAAPHGTNGMPTLLASAGTLTAVGDTNSTPFPTLIKAYRLSSHRQSDFYNVYLSDPFLLLSQSLSQGQLTAIQGVAATQPRFLKAGKYVWAGIDPSMGQNPPVAAYASSAIQGHVVPGRAVLKQSEKERPPLVFIPGMAASRLADLQDFPTSDSGAA
ncbi:MAG TPA: hypothetical protein DCM86_12855, partial [Verrucomicrobiales bacterium]|nr:hypothetical protein [Verrucomicrobiales bacterium]